MVDTDNSKMKAVTYYQNIFFSADWLNFEIFF
jgi:hypothetical protein